MKAKDILWVVVPILFLTTSAFLSPLILPAENLTPIWSGYENFLHTAFTGVFFTAASFNTFFPFFLIAFFVQIILSVTSKAAPLKKYIIMLFSGLAVQVFSTCFFIPLTNFDAYSVVLFSLALFYGALSVISAFLLRLLDTSKHKSLIILFVGLAIFAFYVIRIIRIFSVASHSTSIGIIGGADGATAFLIFGKVLSSSFVYTFLPAILGILITLTAVILKISPKMCSKKCKNVIE